MAFALNTKLSMPELRLPQRGPAGAPRSPAERLWIAAGAAGALLLILVGYLLFIGPQRTTTSAVNQQVSDARTQQLALSNRIAMLRTQNAKLGMYEAQLAAAQQALPADSGVPDLLRNLQSIGAATSTVVSNVSVGAPTAIVAAASTSGTQATGATSATPSGAPAAGTAAPVSTGLLSMTLSTQVSGTPDALNAFLRQLQEVQPRAVLITSLTESSAIGAKASTSSLSLSMLAFMKPATTTAGTTANGTP